MSFVYNTVLDDCQCSLVSTLQSTEPKDEKQFYSCLYQIKEKPTTPSRIVCKYYFTEHIWKTQF